MSMSGVEGVMNSEVWQSIVLWVCGNRMMRLREDAVVLGREGVVVWPKEVGGKSQSFVLLRQNQL